MTGLIGHALDGAETLARERVVDAQPARAVQSSRALVTIVPLGTSVRVPPVRSAGPSIWSAAPPILALAAAIQGSVSAVERGRPCVRSRPPIDAGRCAVPGRSPIWREATSISTRPDAPVRDAGSSILAVAIFPTLEEALPANAELVSAAVVTGSAPASPGVPGLGAGHQNRAEEDDETDGYSLQRIACCATGRHPVKRPSPLEPSLS
jgi:hypothetical protein